MHVVFAALRTYVILFDTLSEWILSSYPVYIWYQKTTMAGLQSCENRMMIDSVVCAQYIIVTDTHTDRQPRRHGNSRPYALRRVAKIKLL